MLKRIFAALIVLSLPVTAWAQTVAPQPIFTGLDSNGDPLASGKLCVYSSGTTTPATTYTSSSLGIPNTNPVILDAAGRANVWLVSGQGYKFILRSPGSDSTCNTGTVNWSVDGIGGVPTTSGNLDVLGTAGEALTAGQVVYLSDGSGGQTAGSWYKADADLTYASIFPLVGIVPSAITSGTPGTIRLAGQATGLGSLAVGSTYFISATAGALTSTAPANRRIVGVADSTSTMVLFPALPSGATTSTITTTGTQTALPIPAGSGTLTLFLNNATLLTLQGIAAGTDGQELDLFSLGAGQVDLANQNVSAGAALRLINGVTGTISLAPGSGRARLQYDGTTARWRVLQHEQGAWIMPAFSAGDYTSSAGSWTVGSGDVGKLAYYLRGRTLSMAFTLDVTTVAGGPVSLFIKTPGGFTNATGSTYGMCWLSDNGSPTPGRVTAVSGDTKLQIVRSDVAAFAAATDTTAVFGSLTFEVQ